MLKRHCHRTSTITTLPSSLLSQCVSFHHPDQATIRLVCRTFRDICLLSTSTPPLLVIHCDHINSHPSRNTWTSRYLEHHYRHIYELHLRECEIINDKLRDILAEKWCLLQNRRLYMVRDYALNTHRDQHPHMRTILNYATSMVITSVIHPRESMVAPYTLDHSRLEYLKVYRYPIELHTHDMLVRCTFLTKLDVQLTYFANLKMLLPVVHQLTFLSFEVNQPDLPSPATLGSFLDQLVACRHLRVGARSIEAHMYVLSRVPVAERIDLTFWHNGIYDEERLFSLATACKIRSEKLHTLCVRQSDMTRELMYLILGTIVRASPHVAIHTFLLDNCVTNLMVDWSHMAWFLHLKRVHVKQAACGQGSNVSKDAIDHMRGQLIRVCGVFEQVIVE